MLQSCHCLKIAIKRETKLYLISYRTTNSIKTKQTHTHTHTHKNNALIGDRKAGGLKMTEFDSMNKVFKASWERRFNTDIKAPWKIIPNYMTQHLRGFKFLLSCNYKTKELTLNNIPSF